MTAPLLANKATFPLHSHLLFPTVYQCALLFLISHLRQDVQQICSLRRCTCYLYVLPEACAFIRLRNGCIRSLAETVCGESKHWRAKQEETSGAQQIHTEVRSKSSGRQLRVSLNAYTTVFVLGKGGCNICVFVDSCILAT